MAKKWQSHAHRDGDSVAALEAYEASIRNARGRQPRTATTTRRRGNLVLVGVARELAPSDAKSLQGLAADALEQLDEHQQKRAVVVRNPLIQLATKREIKSVVGELYIPRSDHPTRELRRATQKVIKNINRKKPNINNAHLDGSQIWCPEFPEEGNYVIGPVVVGGAHTQLELDRRTYYRSALNPNRKPISIGFDDEHTFYVGLIATTSAQDVDSVALALGEAMGPDLSIDVTSATEFDFKHDH